MVKFLIIGLVLLMIAAVIDFSVFGKKLEYKEAENKQKKERAKQEKEWLQKAIALEKKYSKGKLINAIMPMIEEAFRNNESEYIIVCFDGVMINTNNFASYKKLGFEVDAGFEHQLAIGYAIRNRLGNEFEVTYCFPAYESNCGVKVHRKNLVKESEPKLQSPF